MNFFFPHINLYRRQCFWSCVNKKHFLSWNKGGKAFFQVWKPKWCWNEHVLMFKRDRGGWGECTPWQKKSAFEPVGNVVIDRRNSHCFFFFPVDIAGYENWHLVVAIFCSQKNKPQLFCIECNADVVWVLIFFFNFIFQASFGTGDIPGFAGVQVQLSDNGPELLRCPVSLGSRGSSRAAAC